MEISLKRNYGYTLIIKADNVNIEEDIEERTYYKTEDGKIDSSKGPERDVQSTAINQFISILDDMIYYRKKEIDSSNLIENLFEKLPKGVAIKLAQKLKENYEDDNEDS